MSDKQWQLLVLLSRQMPEGVKNWKTPREVQALRKPEAYNDFKRLTILL